MQLKREPTTVFFTLWCGLLILRTRYIFASPPPPPQLMAVLFSHSIVCTKVIAVRIWARGTWKVEMGKGKKVRAWMSLEQGSPKVLAKGPH